ncbi:hypothetical protein AnigIFM60653_011434 [Aspergillus niger]|nr:hypothetical protein AnigIFM60653_011434 [Aspergillus niger]
MADNHHPQAPSLTPLPENDQSHLCGYYYDQRHEPAVVQAPSAQDGFWFQSQPLSGSLLKRLNSIQLVTSSHDTQLNVAGTNRSWFELSISRGNARVQNGHRWMSHENRFKLQACQYHKGRVFTKHSDILKSLKGGDRIEVHAAADHANLHNHRKSVVLLYGICCEGHEQPPQDLVLCEMLQVTPDAPTTFEYLSDTTLGQVMNKVGGDIQKPIVARLGWDDTNEFVTLAGEAKRKKKNVLLLLDAEDLPESTDIDRRLSWGQTVENIWNRDMKEGCNAIWRDSIVKDASGNETSGNNYFHLLVQLGLEGAIYKGFQENATQAHLIYEPTSAKGGFLRSYSDKDMENLNVKSDTDMEILEKDGILVKELMKEPMTAEQREQKKTQLRKQLRKDLGAVWVKGLKSSLEEESTESIANLGITQIRDAIMTGIRWSRRCAPIMFPKGKAKQSQPVDNRLNLETDSEPVLVSVELNLNDAETSSRVPLVLKSLPCSPQNAAQDTLIQGFECVLPYMPSARFGNLITADRGEVDGFRKIANMVHEWYLSNDESKPLSIAVFGQPGSGKSFGVKEVIKSILAADGKGITDLEFNLSQFRKETDLRHAFEVIRGKALSKEVPIVFFDEFDSTFQGRELGWLPHFIKPIKEGKYKDGAVERPLGRGIYIFIGGTKTNHDDFFKSLSNGCDSGGSAGEPINFSDSEEALKDYLNSFDRTRNGVTPPLTCIDVDISKMSHYDQLKDKFYEIRDKTLAGDIPLVFFREFDSNFGDEKLGWLKYFLAPMQDGEFFDHGHRHPLGRAIFVFEQGTEHFNGFPETDLNSSLFPGAKLPDFVSRLRGQIQIGNKQAEDEQPEDEQPEDEQPGAGDTQTEPGNIYQPLENIFTWYLSDNKANKPLSIGLFQNIPDPHRKVKEDFRTALKGYVDILGPSQLGDQDMNYFPIRRAILLRSMLERIFKFAKGKPIEMDTGVRNALLFTPTVLHGARSLESILSMSKINAGNPIKVNDICKEDQRKLHVKDPKFEQYLNGKMNPPNAERDEQHYAWIERKSGRAYKPRPVVKSDTTTTTSAVSGSASG